MSAMRRRSAPPLIRGSSPLSSSVVTSPTPELTPLSLFRKLLAIVLVVVALFSIPDPWNRGLQNRSILLSKAQVLDNSWHVVIAHEPRYDLLGSFVLPTFFLYSVTQHLNWTLVIFPFTGSPQHSILSDLFAQNGDLGGSGLQDVSHRPNFNPMDVNDKSHETMGFFPEVTNDPNIRSTHPWIKRKVIPQPGSELNDVCEAENRKRNNTEKECYILLSDNPYKITDFMISNGGIEAFLTPDLAQHNHRQFLLKNGDRLRQYEMTNHTRRFDATSGAAPVPYFHVAVHIRRGDILPSSSRRWIDQQVFANVAKYICQTNTYQSNKIQTVIHVFSSGPNPDGNWSIMESVVPICAKVYFHLDEVEFDSWTFMIAADALVMSSSTFSYIPALLRPNQVYFPKCFSHPSLSSFTIFDHTNGTIVRGPTY